jgi:hypothetical protein
MKLIVATGETPEYTGFVAKRVAYLENLYVGDTYFDDLDEDQKLDLLSLTSVEPYASPKKEFEFNVNLLEKLTEIGKIPL